MTPTLQVVKRLTIILGAAILAGCASLKPAAVKPWERDILAKPAMQLEFNAMITGCDDHIYFSREASKGGSGFGGGGCGCN
jgi:hypothetical protein